MRRSAEVSLRPGQCGAHACWPAAPLQRQAAGQPQARCLQSTAWLDKAVQFKDEGTSASSKGRSVAPGADERDGQRPSWTLGNLHSGAYAKVSPTCNRALPEGRAAAQGGCGTHLPLATQERMLPAAPDASLATLAETLGRGAGFGARGSRLASVYFRGVIRYQRHGFWCARHDMLKVVCEDKTLKKAGKGAVEIFEQI